jgi:hypothetical protein
MQQISLQKERRQNCQRSRPKTTDYDCLLKLTGFFTVSRNSGYTLFLFP